MAEEVNSEPIDPAQAAELAFFTSPDVPIIGDVSGLTHVGHVKENNEDRVLVDVVNFPVHNIAVFISILADGMGGPPAGEVFAKIAVHEILIKLHEAFISITEVLPYFEQQTLQPRWEFWQYLNSQMEQDILIAAERANERVVQYGTNKEFPTGDYGATLAILVAVADLKLGHVKVYGYNEGDARCAVALNGSFKQLSRDHTVEGKPIRFLGARNYISGHCFNEEFWLTPSTDRVCLLAYSDGLWSMLSDKLIFQTAQANQASVVCHELLKHALTISVPATCSREHPVATGDDNITIAAQVFHTQGESNERTTTSTSPEVDSEIDCGPDSSPAGPCDPSPSHDINPPGPDQNSD